MKMNTLKEIKERMIKQDKLKEENKQEQEIKMN
jgi:hypothetical protein